MNVQFKFMKSQGLRVGYTVLYFKSMKWDGASALESIQFLVV